MNYVRHLSLICFFTVLTRLISVFSKDHSRPPFCLVWFQSSSCRNALYPCILDRTIVQHSSSIFYYLIPFRLWAIYVCTVFVFIHTFFPSATRLFPEVYGCLVRRRFVYLHGSSQMRLRRRWTVAHIRPHTYDARMVNFRSYRRNCFYVLFLVFWVIEVCASSCPTMEPVTSVDKQLLFSVEVRTGA